MPKERERKRERDRAVEPIRHRSSQTQKSSNPFAIDRREPRNRRTILKPKIFPPNRRSTCSGSISSPIRLLSLISDFLVVVVVAWVVLILLFSDFGLISNLMIFFLLGIENLGFDEFGFCWIWWYICLEAEKIWENVRNIIKMGFLEHFQEYNQTLENIFLSRKYFPFWKIFYIQPNIA